MHIDRFRSTGRRVLDAAIPLLFPGGRRVCRVLWSVEGHLFPHEGAFLYQIGRFAAQGRPVVEIGSLRGLSTCCLAAGVRRSPAPRRLVAIDPHLHGSEAELRYNLGRLGLDSVVEVRVARAENAAVDWTEEASAVFIDGAHDLESVARDFELWSPKVRPGGFVLIHDSTPLSRFPGPALVAETKLRVGTEFDAVGVIGSVSWGRKAGADTWLPNLPAAPFVDALIRSARSKRFPQR